MVGQAPQQSWRSWVREFLENVDWRSWAVGFIMGLLGFLALQQIAENPDELLANLVPEAIGIVFTVLILDRLGSIRDRRELLEHLVRRAHSRYNLTALEAIEELRAMDYLQKGVLAHRQLRGSHWENGNLYKADLSGADLRNVILHKADLVFAILKDAQVLDEQLVQCDKLHSAVLPDGQLYDGRFNLMGDFEDARRRGIDIANPQAMADWYGVSLEQYHKMQLWAQENLPKIRPRSTPNGTNQPSVK